MQADIVVKAIMIGLLLWSIWSLAIMFEKWIRLRTLNARAEKFEDAFWSGGSLDALYERVAKKGPRSDGRDLRRRDARMETGERTRRVRIGGAALHGNLQQRVDRVMAVTIGREMAQVEKYMNVLATAGSTATFVGLAGTVYGIMSSFTSIAAEQNTSLAVVAPGIAEALLSTLLGLVVAIPAVMAYNKFASDIGRYGERLDGFSAEFSAILSRHLEGKGLMAGGIIPAIPRGGGRRRSIGRLAEINVTPLVDVMLVLLIVFMVTAPLLTTGVHVDLPKSKAAPLPKRRQAARNLDRQAKGQIFLQETPVDSGAAGAEAERDLPGKS